MLTTNHQTSPGQACRASTPLSWPAETVPENPQASYYRARYYDPSAGRFLNEDPTEFWAGVNFYRYSKNNSVNLVDPFGLNPISGTWPGILINPIVRAAPWARAVGGAIGLFLGELAFPDATGIDDARAIPKPTPCDARRKDCKEQWAKDIAFCAEAFADDPNMQEACYNIADLNLERCLNGQPRVNPRPTPKRKQTP
jgi:RHS repeat-associated protein